MGKAIRRRQISETAVLFGLAILICTALLALYSGGLKPPGYAQSSEPTPEGVAASRATKLDILFQTSITTPWGVEAFVKDVAFIPMSHDVIYTVGPDYPQARMLFTQEYDGVSSELEEFAEPFGGLPDGIASLETLGRATTGNKIVTAGRDGNNAFEGMSNRHEVLVLDTQSLSVTLATTGSLSVATYAVTPSGDEVVALSDKGDIVVIDVTDMSTNTIASEILGYFGNPSVELSISQDGNNAGLVRSVGLITERISVASLSTGVITDVVDVVSTPPNEDAFVSNVNIRNDGTIFYLVSSSVPSPTDTSNFSTLLYSTTVSSGVPPTMVADLSALTGITEFRAVDLAFDPNGTRAVFAHGDGIYSVDMGNPTVASLLSSPTEVALRGFDIIEDAGSLWMVYVHEVDLEAVGYSGPEYVDRSGNVLTVGYFAKVIQLP